MQKISFLIEGSSPEPYETTFIKSNESLFATCTCKAGIIGKHCKHRTRILGGQSDGIISDNIAEISTVLTWLPGSNLAVALSTFIAAEAELEHAKKRVTDAQKFLCAAMRP